MLTHLTLQGQGGKERAASRGQGARSPASRPRLAGPPALAFRGVCLPALPSAPGRPHLSHPLRAHLRVPAKRAALGRGAASTDRGSSSGQ